MNVCTRERDGENIGVNIHCTHNVWYMFLCRHLIQKLIAQFHWAPITLQGGEHVMVSRQEIQWEAHRGTVQITTVSTVISQQVPTARTPLTFGFPQVCSNVSVGWFGPIKNNLM